MRPSAPGRVVGLLLLLAACRGEPVEDQPGEVVFEGADTLVTTRSGMIGQPTSMDVGPQGRLYIADRTSSAVYRLDPADTTLFALTGTGPGPGEVEEPTHVEVTGARILVADGGNGRVQALNPDGEFADSWPLHSRSSILVDLADDGRLVSNAGGLDTARAAVYDEAGKRITDLGTDPFQAPRTVSPARMRSQAARGEVPPIFRLAVLPRFDSHGNVWLALRADLVVQKFSPEGRFLLEHELEQPEIPEIREAYVRANAESDGGLTALNHVADFEDVGGEIWLLLNRPEDRPAVFVVLSQDGEVLRRIRLPDVIGAGTFAVDEERGRMYVGVPSLAMIVAVSTRNDGDGGG